MPFTLTLFAYFPVVLLIYLMVKGNPLPAYKALPLCALVVYLIALGVFDSDPATTHANVVDGLLLATTPILIISGAVFLFRTLENTGALNTIREELNSISDSPVVQLMIVGWAFPFLIEGASGFGTPAALAAPILVGLGFHPLRVAVLVLVMNSVPVSFGAVGTPTWFGFSALALSEQDSLQIGFHTALINGAIALVVPVLALRQLLSWPSIFGNIGFIGLSILCTVVPYIWVASYNYEFPSLVGGMCGLAGTVLLARFNIGLSSEPVVLAVPLDTSRELASTSDVSCSRAKRRFVAGFPFVAILGLLLLTRIPELGLKALLNSGSPQLTLSLGFLGEWQISAALVLGLNGIFGTEVSWSLSLLYIPAILPFIAVALITFYLPGSMSRRVSDVVTDTLVQMKKPAIAMLGALVFVNLMMMGGQHSMVNTIGISIASLAGGSWIFFAPFLGALGSFFSGSATISNLTFGGIQAQIASDIGVATTQILALQSVGAALGNMVCINNIVAVASVLGLQNSKGRILKQTFAPMLVYALMAGLAGWLFWG